MLINLLFSRAKIERLLFAKRDPSGRPLFFPRGLFGCGYVVSTDEEKERIIRRRTAEWDVIFAALLLYVILVPPISTLLVVILPTTLILSYALQSWTVRGLAQSDEALTWGEMEARVAEFMPWPVVIFFALVLAAVSPLVVWGLIKGHGPDVIGIVSLLFVGLCGLFYWRMAYLKWRARGVRA